MINSETISALVDELELANQETSSYMHRETGEIFTETDDIRVGYDDEYKDEGEIGEYGNTNPKIFLGHFRNDVILCPEELLFDIELKYATGHFLGVSPFAPGK